MRSDYILYTVSIIFFILTGIVFTYPVEQRELWTVTTIVLGLLFIGLGYSQRPKAATIKAPAPATATPSKVTEEETETVIKAVPTVMALTEVSGIGDKRAGQLKKVGINSVEDLSKASAKSLAAKLKISAKITGKWIKNSRKLIKS